MDEAAEYTATRENIQSITLENQEVSGIAVSQSPPGFLSAPSSPYIAILSRVSETVDSSRWKRRIVASLEQELKRLGYRTLFFNQVTSMGNLLPLEILLGSALKSSPDAVAFVEMNVSTIEQQSACNTLYQLGKLQVWIGNSCFQAPSHTVRSDEEGSGYQAAQYLCEQGHRNIAMVTLPTDDWGDFVRPEFQQGWVTRRRYGVERACHFYNATLELIPLYPADFGIPLMLNTEDHFPESFWQDSARLVADRFQKFRKRNTGLIALNDAMAVTILNILRAKSVLIPEELSLIGFDNTEEGEALELTTLEPPIEELGKEGAQFLFQRLSGTATRRSQSPVQHLLLESNLIVRNTILNRSQLHSPSPSWSEDAISPLLSKVDA